MHTSIQLQEIENVLSAQLLALEVIANFCYTESGSTLKMYIVPTCMSCS